MSNRGPRHLAKLAGEKTYFSDRPCVRGHTSERLTWSGTCLECRRIRDRSHYKLRYETKIKPRISSPENKKKSAQKMALARQSWSEDKKAAYREAAKLRSREWRKENPKHRNALKSKYLADRNKRMPKWADANEIKKFYLNCPPGHHVDHIIPMRGKNVSGLHVHYNLQYLPAIENMRKNNRFEVA